MSDRRRHGVVVIVRRDDRLLMIRRGHAVPFPGYWAPLSGKLEAGESAEQALVRETREEVGLEVVPVRKVWKSISQDGAFILHWWEAAIVGGQLRPDPREVQEIRWLSLADLDDLEPMFSADREFFRSVFPNASAIE